MKVNLKELKEALQEIAECPVYIYHKRRNHSQYIKISEVIETIKKLKVREDGERKNK